MQWNIFHSTHNNQQRNSSWLPKQIAKVLCLAISASLVVFLIQACHQVKYSDTGTQGIRKVEKGVLGAKKKITFQKYDKELGRYYEAEQGTDGEWHFTEDGNFLRNLNRDQVDGS